MYILLSLSETEKLHLLIWGLCGGRFFQETRSVNADNGEISYHEADEDLGQSVKGMRTA